MGGVSVGGKRGGRKRETGGVPLYNSVERPFSLFN
jgi:hypothetical protein